MSNLLTVKEVADKLRVDKETIYRYVWSKEIPAFKVGGTWRIDEDDLDRYIEKQKTA